MDGDIEQLRGVGPRIRQYLASLRIYSLWDLLFHLPLRYEDRTRIYALDEVQIGDRVVVEVSVISSRLIYGKRASLVCTVCDDSGLPLTLRFFHFNAAQKKQLTCVGTKLRCFGEVRTSYQGGIEMVHPQYQLLQTAIAPELSDQLTPIYPTTKGLSQTVLRRLVKQALAMLEFAAVPDLIPAEMLAQCHYLPLKEALQYIHQPPIGAPINLLQQQQHPAQQRLSFEELLAQRVAMLHLKQHNQGYAAVRLEQQPAAAMILQFIQTLPFQLTTAQQRVIKEIQTDLAKAHPMLRLLQGDVGSGKTVVAMVAALTALANGSQVAVMAPTEILSEQHFANFQRALQPLGISVVFLSGSQAQSVRRVTLEKIATGEAQIIIGTHALFQQSVVFHNLQLVIIDEQHRFGVQQRLALKNKGVVANCHPHQLIMTATPIPRTLTMTVYADLDVSIIDELPQGRVPIKTVVMEDERRDEIIARVKTHCENAGQAYWVCTLIDESELLQAQAAQQIFEELKNHLAHLKIGLVHGRLKAAEKEAVMQQFKQQQLHLLVATTVIEVGVDVPSSNLMIIENAERLGLSQLHQLRGRVGRGEQQSYCVLLYKKPLSQTAKQRLQIMRQTTDGFRIAEEDLRLRGPGEILGVQQAGAQSWRLADLLRDQQLLPQVQCFAKTIFEHYPSLVAPLMQRWLKNADEYVGV